MSQWAHEHPEEMAEIAALPPARQLDALRGAIRTPIDAVDQEEREPKPAPTACIECGAPVGAPCTATCASRGRR